MSLFNQFDRPRIPLFFKLWFVFLVVLRFAWVALILWLLYLVVSALMSADPGAIGRVLGEAVRGFNEAVSGGR